MELTLQWLTETFAGKSLLSLLVCMAAPNIICLAAYRRLPEMVFLKDLLLQAGGGNRKG